jgi:hypothetical protein
MVLTLTQLKALFHEITVAITGLDADSGVRNTYPPQGQPAWKINDNIVFIAIYPVDDQYDKLRDVVYREQTPVTGEEVVSDYTTAYTRVMEVVWTVYGPNSFDMADNIRFGILSAETLVSLAAVEVAPLTEIAAPRRAPDLFDGQWWERSDVRCRFNVLTARTETVPYLNAANIELHTEQGLYGIIEIEE